MTPPSIEKGRVTSDPSPEEKGSQKPRSDPRWRERVKWHRQARREGRTILLRLSRPAAVGEWLRRLASPSPVDQSNEDRP